MRRSHDIASALTHDVQCVVVEIYVTAVIDEVNGTLNEGILHVVAIVRLACCNPCVLIAVHTNLIEHDTVVLCVQGKSLRTIVLLHSV